MVVPTPPLNITIGKNRKWALETKAKGHPKYNATYTKIEERGKPHGENPPSKYNVIKRKEEEKTVAKQLCPSLQDDRAKSETFAQ